MAEATKAYVLVELFYPVLDSDDGIDVNGDQIVAELLPNLNEAIKKEVAAFDFEFMRYSVDGYHIRIKYRVPSDDLERIKESVLPPLLGSYVEAHSYALSQEMVLGDFPKQLYERLNKDVADINSGGVYRLSIVSDDDAVYEDDVLFERYVRFSQANCELLSAGVRDLQSVKLRKILVRFLLAEVLMATRLELEELHYLLLFTKRQWEVYFEVRAEDKVEVDATAQTLADAFHQVLRSPRRIEIVANHFPEAFRSIYKDSISSLRRAIPGLIVRQDSGVMTNNSALRIMSLIHLVHNRMGFDIRQELLFADMMLKYFSCELSASDVEKNEYWVETNISSYMSQYTDVPI